MIIPRIRHFGTGPLPDGWTQWSNDRKRWFYLSHDLRRWWGWFLIPSDLRGVIADYKSKNKNVEDDSSRLTLAGPGAQRRESRIQRI